MAIGEDLDLALRIRALVEGQDAIVNLGTSFVDLNKRIELLTRGLTGVFGSADAASKEFDYLAEVADKYGLQLLGLSESYLKLSAAAKDTNLEGEAARKIFESVSGALAVMGGTTETTERAFTALTQMMSKGQIYSEELKGQLAENLPGAIQTLSNALGIGTQDLLRMMEAGNVTADVLLPFAYELDKQYGKLATSSDTFAQAMNRLKNSWLEVMKGLGDTGIWKALTLTIGALGDNVSVVAGLLGGVFGVAIQKSVVGIANLSSAITENIKSLFNQKAAIQEAAAVAKQSAQAEVAAAEAAAEAAAKRAAQAEIQLRESNLLVAANEREVQSLIAKNAVIGTATQAINKAALADQQLLQAKGRLVAAEEALSAVWASTTAVQNEANLASAERYRLALLATVQNERDLAAGTATLRQAELNLASVNETISAKLKEGAAEESLQGLYERRFILQQRLLAAEKNMEVIQAKKVGLAGNLIVAESELLVSGDKELAQLTKTASARAEDVAKAEAQVAAKEALATAALRNAEGTLAEGGSVQKAADATERLSISQEKNVLIQKEATKATAANVAAQAELAAASQRAALAGTESAAKVGLLARAWGFLTGPAGMIALIVAGFATMLLSFREQSEATKVLAKDTEEYTKSLTKMNVAQLESTVKTSAELISAKQEEIAILKKEIELYDNGATRLQLMTSSWHGFFNMLNSFKTSAEDRKSNVEELIAAEEALTILQGKEATGLIALKSKYEELGEAVSRARANADENTASYERQKQKIEDLQRELLLAKSAHEDQTEITRRLGIATEELVAIEARRKASSSALTTVLAQQASAEQAYAKLTGLSVKEVQAAINGDEAYIQSLDAKSQAIVKNIQDMDRLQKMEKELQSELKASKAEYEALTTATKAKVDHMDKEAKAFGDLNTQRQMAIEKSKLEVQAAEQAAVIANRELILLQTQLAEKNKLLAINDKNAEQTNKEIGEIEALITKKKAEIEVRNSSVGVAKTEAETARIANTLLADSYTAQQAALITAKTEVMNLEAEYKKLLASGAGDSQLELMLQRLAAKNKEVADLTKQMAGELQQSAKDIGQDFEEMTTGMDFGFRKTIDRMKLLASQGILTGQQLKESIGKAIDLANTPRELEAVRDLLISLYTTGQLAEAEFAQQLATLQTRMADVRTAIDPLNSAMKELGIGVPEQLAAVALKMQTNVESMQALGAGTLQVQDGFLKTAEAMLTAEAAGIKIDRNWLEQKAASLGLTEALQQLTEARQRENQEFEAVLQKYQKSQQLFELQLTLIDKEIKKRQEQNQTDTVRNEILGRSFALGKDLVQQSALAVEQAQKELAIKVQTLQRDQEELAELEKLKTSTGGLSEVQQRRLAELQAGIPIQQQDVEAKRQEVAQTEKLQFSYQSIASAMERVSNAATASLSLENRLLEAKKEHLQQEEKMAQAHGDTTTAIRKQNEVLDISVKQAKNDADAKGIAALAAANYVKELIDLANKDGVVTEEEAAGIEVAKEMVEIKDQEAKKAKDVADAVTEEANAKKKANEAGEESARSNDKLANSADRAKDSTESLNVAMIKFGEDTVFAFGASGISRFNELVRQVESSINEANVAAERLNQYGLAAGVDNAESLAYSLKGVKGYLQEAANTAADNLLSALQSAREEAQGLAQDLASMAADFEREILQIQGNQAALEDLEYRDKLAKLEELHRLAGGYANDEYNEAVSRLNLLHQMRLDKLRQEKEERDRDAKAQNDSTNSTTGAMSGLADQAERAHRAISSMGATDLSGLYNQIETLGQAARGLAGAL